MSIFKKLFGGSSPSSKSKEPDEHIMHEGYKIVATPRTEDGGFRLCAQISRDIEGETKTHKMVRADIFPDRQGAVDGAYRKAKQMIKEQGDRIF